jgi:signal peptidase I
MFDWIFNRKSHVEKKYLCDVIHHVRKRLRQDHDLLSEKQTVAIRREIQKAQNVLTGCGDDVSKATNVLVQSHDKIFPPVKAAAWRENGEVILVALVVAMAVRAFFLQPFKIPTGSMQPTLNGITVREAQSQEKKWYYKLISLPVFGERIIHQVAETEGEINRVKPIKVMPFHFGGKNGFFNLLPMDATEYYVGNTRYTVPLLYDQFAAHRGELVGHVFKPGETIIDWVVQTGDQLFVDRCTYHFRKPLRGDVFVFDTTDIMEVRNRGDFYIKRIAGVPGDTLQIKDPELYVNGKKITEPAGFLRVMSRQNGYGGYTSHLGFSQKYLLGPDDSFSIPEKQYFALGDNSFHSSDSRVWGTVPYHDIVGRGFFVYWPFTRHFGRVD